MKVANVGASDFFNKNIDFNVNPSTGKVIVQVSHGSKVTEIPSHASQKVDDYLQRMSAVFFDTEA